MNETVSEIALIWDRALAEIKKRLDDAAVYSSFFDGTYVDSIEGSTLIVVVSSFLAKEILHDKYEGMILEALALTTGTNYKVRFCLEADLSVAKASVSQGPEFFKDAHLNPKNTFENFVVGSSNREAFQASLMIARNPGQFYNPLLLHADSGLGKTHLMHAIGNAIKQHSPTTKVLCISASDFVDEYVRFAQGYQESQSIVQYFKADVDVLLIDDIQFLVGKKKTMEMFFTVFTSLINRGKQIAITSDQHPGNLDGLDDRLKTRFVQGLVLKIEHPDIETSKQILRAKIAAAGIGPNVIKEDAIALLAANFSSNVRELEGALNRLLFFTVNCNPTDSIDAGVAEEAISSLISVKKEKTTLTETRIISVVAEYYSLTPSQLTGKIRTAQIAMARHVSMYLIKTMLGDPYTKIGGIFGGRDHTTVMNGIGKVENELKTSLEMQQAISELKAKLAQ